MAEPITRCYECGQFPPCKPDCTRPLEVRRYPDDAEEQLRAATALERANAGAAQALLDRGIHPHTYRAGDGLLAGVIEVSKPHVHLAVVPPDADRPPPGREGRSLTIGPRDDAGARSSRTLLSQHIDDGKGCRFELRSRSLLAMELPPLGDYPPETAKSTHNASSDGEVLQVGPLGHAGDVSDSAPNVKSATARQPAQGAP